MGLDMNISISVNVPSHYWSKKGQGGAKQDLTFRKIAAALPDFKEVIDTDTFNFITMELPVAYWRKFNALHGYIVENFANGVDDCRPVTLTKENIKTILSVLEDIKQDPSKAQTLMPPTEGFFFGTYKVDDDYMNQVEYTIEKLSKLIETPAAAFTYQASW